MGDPRYAIPVDELEAAARVSREEQVEIQQVSSTPPPAVGEWLPFGDGMGGDGDCD